MNLTDFERIELLRAEIERLKSMIMQLREALGRIKRLHVAGSLEWIIANEALD
jgi:prefoldin subunit 5